MQLSHGTSSPEGVEQTTMIDLGRQGMDVRCPLVLSWVVPGGPMARVLDVLHPAGGALGSLKLTQEAYFKHFATNGYKKLTVMTHKAALRTSKKNVKASSSKKHFDWKLWVTFLKKVGKRYNFQIKSEMN